MAQAKRCRAKTEALAPCLEGNGFWGEKLDSTDPEG